MCTKNLKIINLQIHNFQLITLNKMNTTEDILHENKPNQHILAL